MARTPGSADTRDASEPPAVRPSRTCGGQRGSRHKGGNDGMYWKSRVKTPTAQGRTKPYISWRLQRAVRDGLVKDQPAAGRAAAARSAVLEQPGPPSDRLAVRCRGALAVLSLTQNSSTFLNHEH
ncbi:hypothetical protein CC_3516 [Caulobacter vibrioides CB15]|uniref:Uncharacterized protein n=1 Tax=Caulobacter vibrioides (strain ATCC 19089 / CIP 103742 / CB 15) TaxID=190650 RepID=Q9A2P0_CAUVC|nr:hypothetical protein CC_3516 [Caulobacter vibrioides CB15]